MGAVVLAVHVVGVSFMCGLGWIVQLVHYPLFSFAAGDRWTEFHAEHSRRISWVVGVPWAMQGLGVLALLVWRPVGLPLATVVVALVLSGITVVATVVFALPVHGRLSQAFSPADHRRLVSTNWIRTIAWTAGVCVAAAMIVEAVSFGVA